MSAAAANTITIDDEVLANQVRVLEGVATRIKGLTGPASTSLGSTSFGVINSYLVGPINHWAARSGECVETAGEYTTRMAGGVDDARRLFAECEENAIAALKKLDLGAEQ